MKEFLIIAVGLLFGIVMMIPELIKKRRELSFLGKREPLSYAEIYHKFYESSDLLPEDIKCLWQDIANALKIPAGQMRPEDKIGKDIGASFWFTNERLDALDEVIQLRTTQIKKPLKTIITVDDYIRQFARSD